MHLQYCLAFLLYFLKVKSFSHYLRWLCYTIASCLKTPIPFPHSSLLADFTSYFTGKSIRKSSNFHIFHHHIFKSHCICTHILWLLFSYNRQTGFYIYLFSPSPFSPPQEQCLWNCPFLSAASILLLFSSTHEYAVIAPIIKISLVSTFPNHSITPFYSPSLKMLPIQPSLLSFQLFLQATTTWFLSPTLHWNLSL